MEGLPDLESPGFKEYLAKKSEAAPVIPPTIMEKEPIQRTMIWYRTPIAISVGVAALSGVIFALSPGTTFVKMSQEANIDAVQKTHRDVMKIATAAAAIGLVTFLGVNMLEKAK
jgi:hypothetical protein